MKHLTASRLGLAAVLAAAALAPAHDDEHAKSPDPQVGKTFEVPYRLTETNHFMIRVRINGQGPFNLIVDTGAPALFLSSDAAEKAGLETKDKAFFKRIDRLEIEGGAELHDVQTRIEDIFQMVGMNALGLPGARIDGMLGFNVLARYRITIDPTDDRMTWTRLDYEPPELVAPAGGRSEPPPGVQAMSMLGGVAKLAAAFVGKQPEDKRIPRGFLGLELNETDDGVTISGIVPGSPAATADINVGDRLVRVLGRNVESIEDARKAVSKVEAGDQVTLRIQPQDAEASDIEELDLTAGKGL